MKRYFLETSVIVAYLRGDKRTVELIDNLDGELAASYISLAELYEGVNRVKKKEKVEKAMSNFFAGLDEIYGVDQDIAETFGRYRSTLKKKGNVIEDIDLFLAVTCVTYNLVMITYNQKHFRRIEKLQIYGESSTFKVVP